MPSYICVTCGNEYWETEEPPLHCRIYEDQQQYVNPEAQTWTSLDELRQKPRDVLKSLEHG